MVLKIPSKSKSNLFLSSTSNGKLMLEELEDITPVGVVSLTPKRVSVKTKVGAAALKQGGSPIIKADVSPKFDKIEEDEYDDEEEFEEEDDEYDEEQDNTRTSAKNIKVKSKLTCLEHK